nr:radical SAM protein [uncultured Methanomethylovorans sp.]
MAVAIKGEGITYLYDSFSNRVYSVPQAYVDILDDFYCLSFSEILTKHSKYSHQSIRRYYKEIEEIIESQNAFRKFQIEEFSVYDKSTRKEVIYKKLTNSLTQLLFNVTEDCNLRCKYCVYGGNHSIRREHNIKNELKWNVAKQAVDFFLKNSQDSEAKFITFYGGEPLLKFSLIKNIIVYASKIDPKVRFALTTNGTLLNPERVHFLIDQKVTITISIDGPDEIHNKRDRKSVV